MQKIMIDTVVLEEESLSAAMSALKSAINEKNNETEGFEEVELAIGEGTKNTDYTIIRFDGKLLSEIGLIMKIEGPSNLRDLRTDYSLYLTRNGKFLVYIDEVARFEGELPKAYYRIYDTLEMIEEDYEASVPMDLINDAKQTLKEDVDI